jgi:hypothetical protein
MFGLTNIIPGAICNRIRGVFSLDTSSPKLPNDGINLCNKGLGKKDIRHVINRNRRKN